MSNMPSTQQPDIQTTHHSQYTERSISFLDANFPDSHRLERSQNHRNFTHDQITNRIAENFYLDIDLSVVLVQNAEEHERYTSGLTSEEARILKSSLPEYHNDKEMKHLVKMWYVIFDKLFFFGTIHNKVELIYTSRTLRKIGNWSPSWLVREGDWLQSQFDYLSTSLGCFDARYNKLLLIVNNIESAGLMLEISKEALILGVLLHEMTHAFFHLYSCQCSSCEANKDAIMGGMGAGHGPPFLEALLHFEIALRRCGVQWTVRTGLLESIQLEMTGSSWVPETNHLERWLQKNEIVLQVCFYNAAKNGQDSVWQQRVDALLSKIARQRDQSPAPLTGDQQFKQQLATAEEAQPETGIKALEEPEVPQANTKAVGWRKYQGMVSRLYAGLISLMGRPVSQ